METNNYGVQELSMNEIKETNGGWFALSLCKSIVAKLIDNCCCLKGKKTPGDDVGSA